MTLQQNTGQEKKEEIAAIATGKKKQPGAW